MPEQIIAFLIDDDQDDQKFFQMALKRMAQPIYCEYADDGVKGLVKLKDESFSPDFIFLDINMPLMNGFECLREIRKIARFKKTPIYMYSTSADEKITDSSIILGATGVIKKVPSVEQLKAILWLVFHKHKVISESGTYQKQS